MYRDSQDNVIGPPATVPADRIIFFDADQDTGPDVATGDTTYSVQQPTSQDLRPQQRELTWSL